MFLLTTTKQKVFVHTLGYTKTSQPPPCLVHQEDQTAGPSLRELLEVGVQRPPGLHPLTGGPLGGGPGHPHGIRPIGLGLCGLGAAPPPDQ